MALPQVQSYRAQVAQAPSAATPAVSFGQPTRADLAVQAGAQYYDTLGRVLDRMSTNLFGLAEKQSEREGLQFAIENPLTAEQLDAMVRGRMPEDLDLGDPLNVFNNAVRKARASEVSSHAEVEIRAKAMEILQKAEDGQIDTEKALSELNGAINGVSSVLGTEIDPDASYTFRASTSKYAAQVINEVAKIESRKRKIANEHKTNQDYSTFQNEVLLAAQGELPINEETGQPWDMNTVINKSRDAFLRRVNDLVGAEGYNKYAQQIDNDILKIKSEVIMEGIFRKDPDIGGDAFAAMNRLRTGNGGKFQAVYNSMLPTQQAAMRKKIGDAFTEMVALRDADRARAKAEAEPEVRGLIAQYHKKPTPQLLDQIRTLSISTGVVDIDYVENLPKKIAEKEIKNPLAEMRLKDMVSKGLIPDLNTFLREGQRLGVGLMRLNEIYSYKENYEKGTETQIEKDARSIAKLTPGASNSTMLQAETYFGHFQSVEDAYKNALEVWEASGRTGVPPTKSKISSGLIDKRRTDTAEQTRQNLIDGLYNTYGVNGTDARSNVNFRGLQNEMKYDEASSEPLTFNQSTLDMLNKTFDPQTVEDIRQKVIAIIVQERKLNEIRP